MVTSEKIISGSSVRVPEVDDEELENREENTSAGFSMSSILDSIGTDEFKSVYSSLIEEIKLQDIPSQQVFCLDILEKINEVYEFEFPSKVPLDSQTELNRVYEFLEFLEFDYINFLARLWKFLGVDLKTVEIEKFCDKNADKIMTEIDEQVEVLDLPEMISTFLRTYYKEGMIEFVGKRTSKDRMLIVLRIIEGE